MLCSRCSCAWNRTEFIVDVIGCDLMTHMEEKNNFTFCRVAQGTPLPHHPYI